MQINLHVAIKVTDQLLPGKGSIKEEYKNLGCDSYIHYLDCNAGLTTTCQNSNCIF